MRAAQRNKIDFTGQNIYVGIDVHLKELVGNGFVRNIGSEEV